MNQFLREYYVDDRNDYYNIVSMIAPRGKYNINRKQYDYFIREFSSQKSGIAEVPRLHIPLYFDFDIKKDSVENGEVHFYTEEQVKSIISIITTLTKKHFDVKDKDLFCCLLEKDIYQKSNGKFSNGFHLHFPSVFVSRDIFRTCMLPILEAKIKQETGFIIDDVYNHPWLLYGNVKDDKLQPYILTKVFNVDLNQMTVFDAFKNYKIFDEEEKQIQINDSNVDSLLPRIFSINVFGRNVNELVNKFDVDIPKKIVNVKPKIEDNRPLSEKAEEVKKFLPLILDNETYQNWYTIGQAIYNILEGQEEGFQLFIDWSRSASNFDESYCEKLWKNMRFSNSGIGTLIYQAKLDSKELFNEINKPKQALVFIDNDIIECGEKIVDDFTHNNLAKIYSNYSKGEIFYTTAYGWIIYDKITRIWTYNNDKTSLIFPISSFFCNIMKEYSSFYFNKNNNLKLSKHEEEEFLKKIKEITKMKREVGNSSFISGVISQVQSILTKPSDFIDNFDNKPNLFAFSDGKCIDMLNNGMVREIEKDDYIMTTCGYPYPIRDEFFIEKMNNIINSLSDDNEQIRSIKTLLSLGLWGENKNEIFAQLTGSGGNGKGLLDTGIKKVYGKYYQCINSNQLTDYEKENGRANSELASCRFARIVMATEPADSKNGKSTTLKVPTLKKWTGRDVITTRFLHKDCFSFTAKFTLMMQLNDLIDLSTNDEAIKRRMKVIELPFKFVENNGQELTENEKYRDESLKTIISTEEYRNAFLFILIDCWLENNGKFFESAKVKLITNEFFEEQNPVKSWFLQKYEIDNYSKISATDMFNSYKNDNYENIINMTAFGRLLKECCPSKKLKNGNVYNCKRKKVEIEYLNL